MFQLIDLEKYFQQQSKNKQYLHVYISKMCLPNLSNNIKSEYNNPFMTQLLQQYLLKEHFLTKDNNYVPVISKNKVTPCAYAYINEDICRHLFKHHYGQFNNKLLLLNKKPIFIKVTQSGGRREHGDYWHLYNYKARIHPLFVDFALRGGLSTLWWNRFFLNFYPIDEGAKNTLRALIDMVRSKKHPVGKMYRFFYSDWFLTRVRSITIWFIINILRFIPEPATQSLAHSIALNSINNDIDDKTKDFSRSLRKLTSGSGGPFSGFPALQEFFEKSKGFLPMKPKKELIEKLRPKEIKYQILKDGQPVTKSVIVMTDVNHLFTYLKGQLDEFLEDNPKQFNKLVKNIDNTLIQMTNLISSIITGVTQYDCGAIGVLVQMIAQKPQPDVVVMFIKQIFNVIPTNLRKVLLDPDQVGNQIKEGLRVTMDTIKKFPDSLEDFFKKNVPSVDPSKVKKLINNIKSTGITATKDTVAGMIDTYLISNVEHFIELFYLIIPLILIFTIIRGYSYDSQEQAKKEAKKSDEEKKRKDPRMGLVNIQNHSYYIWLIESKKLIDKES